MNLDQLAGQYVPDVIKHHIFATILLAYIFSTIVSYLPEPDPNANGAGAKAYKALFGIMHAFAANLKQAWQVAKGFIPGGTMKTIAIIAICLLAVSAAAQTPTATPAPSATPDCSTAAIQSGTAESNCGLHFIPGSAFYQLSNGKQATEFDARLPLTSRVSGFAALFVIPGAQGNITVAGGEFREKLGHLLSQKVTANANLNLNKIEVFGRVGLGSEVNALNNSRAFAFLTEIGLEFPLAQINGGPVISTGVRLGYVGVPHPGSVPEKFVLGSNVAVSPQITLGW